MAMDPTEPDTLYVSTAQRLRYRWNDPKASPQAGIYKTTDGFKTYTALTNGLPDFSLGECERIGLTVCASQPNVIYAALNMCDASGGCANLYRSNDNGESWNQVENNDDIRSVFPVYAWFFGQVRVDPSDPDIIYIMGLSFKGSDDGGKTWNRLRGSHVDYHGMWINPTDSNHLLVVNDGGLMISHDKFATHDHPTNLPIAQLYNAGVSMATERFQIYSSVQDHGAWRGEVDLTQGRNNIPRKSWEGAPGDESGRHAVDPLNPDVVYAVSRYGGGPSRTDYGAVVEEGSRRRRGTSVAPDFGDDKKRAQWVSPIIISPHSNERLLYGAQFVFVTDNRGDEWRRISPDLTNFDPEKQGNIAYSIVYSIAESPLKKGLIYAGTDDGNIQVTQDEGETWKKVIAGLPEGRCISSIAASAFDEGTVYAIQVDRLWGNLDEYRQQLPRQHHERRQGRSHQCGYPVSGYRPGCLCLNRWRDKLDSPGPRPAHRVRARFCGSHQRTCRRDCHSRPRRMGNRPAAGPRGSKIKTSLPKSVRVS